jgi:hypothetical protein
MKKDKEEKEGKKPFTSMFSTLGKLKSQEREREEKFKGLLSRAEKKNLTTKELIEYKKELESGREKREKENKEYKRARTSAILKGVGAKAEQISGKTEKVIMSLGKLGKPKVKLPSHSSKAILRGLARENEVLVRQVPEREHIEDHRSLFFNKEFIKEKENANRWLLR